MSTHTNRGLQGLVLLAASLIVMTISLFYWTVTREISIEKKEMREHFHHVVDDISALQTSLLRAIEVETIDKFPPTMYYMDLKRQTPSDESITETYSAVYRVTGLTLQIVFPTRGDEAANRDEARRISMFAFLVLSRFRSSLNTTSLGKVPIALFDLKNGSRVVFGCTREDADALIGASHLCVRDPDNLVKTMRERRGSANRVVYWGGAAHAQNGPMLAAYAKIKDSLNPDSITRGEWWIAATLDFADAPQFPHISAADGKESPSFEIHSQDGRVLTPQIAPPRALIPGVELLHDASILRTESQNGWAAEYRLSYITIFDTLYRQLAAIAMLTLVSGVVALLFMKWYFKRYYEPVYKQRQRIEESEAFARGVIDVAQVAMCVLGRPSGEILRANALASEWLGDKDELNKLGRSWVNRYAQGDTTEESVSLNIKNRHLSGYFAQTRYEDHDALLCTFSDVSAHVKAQESLSTAKQVSDQASAAKSVFLATMSHEIRTPLYGVLGTLELLSETPLSVEQKSYLDTTQRSAGMLLGIIGDVLDMSKIESGVVELKIDTFSPLELTEMVTQAYTATASNKALSLHCVVHSRIPRAVRGDADRIRQILSNLLSNAIKFTEVGRLRISLDLHHASDTRATLVWRISDSGIGIPDEDQSKLFDPFFQVYAEPGMTSGTGLGLAICKSLVELMGGRIDVVSKLGVGSTFSVTIDFPLVDAAIAVEPAEDLHDLEVVVRAPTVELRRHYRQWLEQWGVQCNTEATALQKADGGAVLLNVSPDLTPPMLWHGMQIIATEKGPLQPQRQPNAVRVSSYSLGALADALVIVARHRNDAPPAHHVSDSGIPAQPFTEADANPTQRLRGLGLRVLVAEDSAINQEVLKRQLTSLGCSVTLCSDGVAALKAWSNEKFDLLLTDVNMPGLGGPELIGRLRKQGMNKPIICVTANAQPSGGGAGGQSGIDAWLVKPIKLQTLQTCLLRVVADGAPGLAEAPEVFDAAPDGVDAAGKIPSFMLGIFLSAMEEDAALMRRCSRDGDHAGLKSALHRVRGGLVMSNQEQLAARCQDIENQLHEGPQDGESTRRVAGFIDALEALLDRLQARTPQSHRGESQERGSE
ncbi:Sensor histidine kinase RcsC [Achromobacter marplatensis]